MDALTVSVETGEVFALLGANGAGKTVMKMLTTLLRPTAGNAQVATVAGKLYPRVAT